MARATLLLPDAARFGGQRWSADVARMLGRGNIATHAAGRKAQLSRHVQLPPGDVWPIAALSRQSDVGDAEGSAWLRADPACLQADINGVRLLAVGEGLQLSDADRDALLPVLKPLFGDAGFSLDAPYPARWYLRLPSATPLPLFSDPDTALGDDLFEHHEDAPAARRWRALASEVQVVLHNHPWNVQRAQRGLPHVNALWFWGGGTLPSGSSAPHSLHAVIHTDDETLRALAGACTLADSVPARYPGDADDRAFDLIAQRDLRALEDAWLRPALGALARGEIDALELDGADGRVIELHRSHRWRWWRQPLASGAGAA